MPDLQSIPPGMIMMFGALFLPLFPRTLQGWVALLLPVLSFAHLLTLNIAPPEVVNVMGLELVPIRVDRLSLIFGYVFHIAGFMAALFALKVDNPIEHLAGMIYAGAAVAAAFCGDLLSLFIYWELTALSSVFLIWAPKIEDLIHKKDPEERALNREASIHCGVRYLVIQVASGVILLAGTMMYFQDTGSLLFNNFYEQGMSNASTVILWAFGIKAAFPFLHNWLQDAYPKATYSGTVFLSAFTTKLAIYALARGFAGFSFLIPIGCIMTLFPIFFAVIENDLRKVLAYSLNNQLGFMVVGIGIGTELAINGACAHAFAHIIYKGLLFMSMGAVLYRVGTTKASELGGLHRTMPWTTTFCIIGAMSISAFPLMSGFAAKSVIASAAGEYAPAIVTFVLLFASAGVMEHSGIKIPFFAFFAHDSGKRPEEAPWNMIAAMALAAILCIAIGVYPKALYQLLPYQEVVYHGATISMLDYTPYDVTHVVTQLELLLFAALAFAFLMRTGVYPAEERAVNLDFDWVYRRLVPKVVKESLQFGRELQGVLTGPVQVRFNKVKESALTVLDPEQKILGRTVNSGHGALWASILLSVYLVLYYF